MAYNDKRSIEEMARHIPARIFACDVSENSANLDEKHREIVALHLYRAGYRKIPDNIGDFSDGYHTFNELYHHRAVLFSVICNMFPEKAWKSKLHDTGDMYEGMFIVGIETEQGQATYHYDVDPYWDMFKVKELEKAPKWDGHTPSDAIERIGSLSCEGYRQQSENVVELPCKVGDFVHFKGLETPWKVSAIHIYEEGQPQISITSGTGKITSTMTANEFYMFCFVIADAKMKGGE